MAACILCGVEDRVPAIVKDGYRYTRCTGCDLVSLDPLPTEETCRSLYSQSYFAGDEGGYADYLGDEPLHRRNARARCRLLASLMPEGPGSLVDVGCATGFFLDEARRQGWRVTGVEASPWAADEARRRAKASVHATLQAASRDGAKPRDAVTFYQVLEHLADPSEALAQARACLRPGGFLILETWDRRSWIARLSGAHWQQVTPPSVVHLFSRQDLRALFERTGLQWHSASRASKAVSVGFVANLLAGKYPTAFGWLARGVERLGLGRLAIPYRLGDLITVVGERRTTDPSAEPPRP